MAALTLIKVLVSGDSGSISLSKTEAPAVLPSAAGKKSSVKKAAAEAVSREPRKRVLGQLDVDAVMQVCLVVYPCIRASMQPFCVLKRAF